MIQILGFSTQWKNLPWLTSKTKCLSTALIFVSLQNAGNAVKRATEALVREAQKAKEWSYEETNVTIDQRMVSGMAQVSGFAVRIRVFRVVLLL